MCIRDSDRLALRRMFTASRDIMIRTVLLQLCFTTFIFLGAREGDVTPRTLRYYDCLLYTSRCV